jgi:hypothetical protein
MFLDQTTLRNLAPLLLVALLSCHGFLGAPHHAPGPPDHSHHATYPAGEHPSHAPAEEPPNGHPGLHLGHSGYAVVLISFLIGATLVLLLSGTRAWRKPAAVLRLTGWPLPSLVLHPPRGPTAPLVQVFRL